MSDGIHKGDVVRVRTRLPPYVHHNYKKNAEGKVATIIGRSRCEPYSYTLRIEGFGALSWFDPDEFDVIIPVNRWD